MSAEREELRRLIEDLPDERVADVLADVRRVIAPPPGPWPPPWVGAVVADRSDISRRHNELLAEGFGRDS